MPMTQGDRGLAASDIRVATARNVAYSGAAQVATLLLAVGTTIVTARWLGPAGRGVLSMIVAGATVGSTVLSLGFAQAVGAYVARSECSTGRAFTLSVIVSVLAGALALLALGTLGRLIPALASVPLGLVPLGVAAVTLSQAQSAVANARGRVELGAANTVLTAGLLLLGYVAAWLFGGVLGEAALVASWVWLLAQSAGDIVGWTLIGARAGCAASGAFSAGEFARFSLISYPATLIGQLNLRADVLVLGLLASKAEVGLYATAVVGMSIVTMVPSSLGQALTRPFGQDPAQARRGLRIGIAGAVWGSVAVGLVLAVAMPVLVPLLLGRDFASISLLVAVLVPGMALFSAAYVTSGYYAITLNRPSLNTLVAGVALALDMVLLVVLAPRFGSLGAAVASSVAYACAGALNLVLARVVAGSDAGLSLVPHADDVRAVVALLRTRRKARAS